MARVKAKRSLKKRSAKIPLANRPSPIEPLGLRVPHAAHVLSISERTLWDYIRDGRVEVVRPSAGITLVLMCSIRKLIGAPAGE
jgi:hypothetical protein